MIQQSNAQGFGFSTDQMFKCSNVHMSNVEYQVSNVNKVKLFSERTSGVPPVIFILLLGHGERGEGVGQGCCQFYSNHKDIQPEIHIIIAKSDQLPWKTTSLAIIVLTIVQP